MKTPRPGSGALKASFIASALIQAMNIATGVILARKLGPASRGELAAIILWPSILATVGSLGVSDATTFLAARRTGRVGTLLGSALAIAAVQSVVLMAVGAAIYPLVFGRHGGDLLIAYLYLGFIPIYLAYIYVICLLNGLQDFFWFNVLRLCSILGPAVGLCVLVLADSLSVGSSVVVYLVGNAIALVAGLGVALHRLEPRSIRVDLAIARQMIAYGIRSHTTAVASLLNQRLDQLLISIFLAPARLGLYVTAVTFTSPTNLIGSSVSLVALPVLASMKPGRKRTVAAARYVAQAFVASVAVTLPILMFTPQMIRFFFGAAFLPAATASRILLVAAVILSMNRVFGSILKAVGRPLDAGMAEFAGVVATMGGLAVLLPRFGLVGAASASLLAYSIVSVWMLGRVLRSLDVTFREAIQLRLASTAEEGLG